MVIGCDLQPWIFGEFFTPALTLNEATCSLKAPCFTKQMLLRDRKLVHLIELRQLANQRLHFRKFQIPEGPKGGKMVLSCSILPSAWCGFIMINYYVYLCVVTLHIETSSFFHVLPVMT